MVFYSRSDDSTIERVEKVVSNDKSQETAVVVSNDNNIENVVSDDKFKDTTASATKDQNTCSNADWSIVWDDTHALWGGMKSIVCGETVVIEVKNQGGGTKVYKGVLSEKEEQRLYVLAGAVTKTSPPKPPKTLPPDFSIIDLQIEQGGDIYSYQMPFNEKIPEIQALYDELGRIINQIASKSNTPS
jgi:hypothetical protein